jgi:hypothetical protein
MRVARGLFAGRSARQRIRLLRCADIPVREAAFMLSGKSAIVTGSTSGIGLGIVKDDATSITGAVLAVDGGWTAH